MESLNLNNLVNSLPSSSYANAEKELSNNFKAAALSLTTLFRTSKTASKRAYNAGYSAACHDLLSMIQQGVSADADPSREVTIGRIMDYIEARLEAIKSREEEEEEEDERERVARAGPTSVAASAPASAPASASAPPKPAHAVSAPKPPSPTLPPVRREQAPPTPYTPTETTRPFLPPALSPTPSLFTSRSAPLMSNTTTSPLPLRASKSRLVSSLATNPKELSSIPLPSSPVPFTFEPITLGTPPAEVASMKRRRESAADAVVAASPEVQAAGTSRRRTRSWRGENQQHQHSAGSQSGDAMDVEEEGPQRKRVARR
ncbi:uncharacterized protein BXZ73DRAFT_102915 [Epithele typhae]|uniref:uncharacterized protein n=1 Tax=Epithele typhae TaxID=378194 RepID=UPI002008B044|nr:uncharacterized protein BXZ73DRAFT_102915 [Epithele typhae]KAH9926660.1 hypothetical protein BXZ73DRAFT_102915 [Epithele typhae]